MRKKKFDGSISEIMVAYQPNQELDFGPVRKMVEFQIKNGIDGLFMGGLSTQTYLLTMEEKRRVGEELCNAAAGRVPVMMNVMEDSIKNAKQLVQDYMDIGVDAVCISQALRRFSSTIFCRCIQVATFSRLASIKRESSLWLTRVA